MPTGAPRRAVPWLAVLLLAAGSGCSRVPEVPASQAPQAAGLSRVAASATVEFLRDHLRPADSWYRVPAYPSDVYLQRFTPQQAEALIKRGEQRLTYAWPAETASSYLAFDATGDRNAMEDIAFERVRALDDLVEAELIERQGRFLPQIINGIWSFCENSFWGISAHVALQKRKGSLPDVTEPVIDLFVSQKAAKLAHIYQLFKNRLDAVHPLIGERLMQEMDRRVFMPYLARDDFWWLGFNGGFVNNWNPWINSNVLQAALLMERDPDRRARIAHKAMRSIDRYLDFVKADGWCDEGPSYWAVAGAKVFAALDSLRLATDGAVDVFHDPLIRNLGSYIYNAYIGDDYYVNFADAAAKNFPDPELVFRWGEACGDTRMMGFASFLAQRRSFIGNPRLTAYPPWKPVQGDFWFPDNQIGGGREQADSDQGLYFVAKGGHNHESHNHNDIGNVILFCDNVPFLIDAGKLHYTKDSFGPLRYTFWPTRSDYHNVPNINGVEQAPGANFRARDVRFHADDREVRMSLDLAGAYPPEAAVATWQRTVCLTRGGEFRLQDHYELTEHRAASHLNFLTCAEMQVDHPGLVTLTHRQTRIRVHYDPTALEAVLEPFAVNDRTVEASWGKQLARLRFRILAQALTNTVELRIVRDPAS